MPIDKQKQAARIAKFKAKLLEMKKGLEGDRSFDLHSVPGAYTTLSPGILIHALDEVLKKIDDGEFDDFKLDFGKYFKRQDESQAKPYDKARSYTVFLDANGEFNLYLEPKSKLFDNSKREIEYNAGGFKVCKVAYRIDVWPFIPCAALVVKRETDGLEYEITANNAIASKAPEFFSSNHMVKDSAGKTHIYSEHVEYDLWYVVNSNMSVANKAGEYAKDPELDRTLITFGDKQVEAWRLALIQQLIKAIQAIHAEGVVQRDLKSENVLCEYDALNKRFNIKIIDFGLSKPFGTDLSTQGTLEYIPPETFVGAIDGSIATRLELMMSRLSYIIAECSFEFKDEHGRIADNQVQFFIKELLKYEKNLPRILNHPDKINLLIKNVEDIEEKFVSILKRKYPADYAQYKRMRKSLVGFNHALKLVANKDPVVQKYTRDKYNRGEHDMWSFGVLCKEILQWSDADILKGNSSLHELVKKTFNLDPSQRYKVEQAQEKMSQVMQEATAQVPGIAGVFSAISGVKTEMQYTQAPLIRSGLEQIAAVLDDGADDVQFTAANKLLHQYFSIFYRDKQHLVQIMEPIRYLEDIYILKDDALNDEELKQEKLESLTKLIDDYEEELAHVWSYNSDWFAHQEERVDENSIIQYVLPRMTAVIYVELATAMRDYVNGDRAKAAHALHGLINTLSKEAKGIESHSKKPFRSAFGAKNL